eukprot:m.57397 g.57397  ORF g.57397 m.57397 type:complete len:244 (-) comp13724_c0_seq7:1097-1828(-)
MTSLHLFLFPLALSCALATPAPPVFPDRWQAVEQTVVVEGPSRGGGTGLSHFDGPNQRAASTNLTGSMYDVIITDFTAGTDGRTYYIRTYGGERHCQFWCEPDVPEICDVADSLCSSDYKNKATFVGNETVDGVATNKFFWTENLGPIPMNSLLLYVNADSPVPVRMYRDIHPFGKPLGNATIDFQSFQTPSSFPDSLFDLGPDAKYDCDGPEPGESCQDEAVLRSQRHHLLMLGSRLARREN